jgi:Flp pilus assembly protein TadD
MRSRRRDWVLAALVGCLATIVYLPSLANGFLYDDHEVIGAQPRPTGVADLAPLFAEPHFRGLPYYRPVVRASLLAQKGLHGDIPALFHLGNALLAGAAAAAAFALLRAPGFALAPAPAAIAAALFAIHPVASSVVHPIASGRETLLPAVLVLVSLAAWLRDRRGAALASFAAALFAKEQAAVVPLLFALADLCRISPSAPPPQLAALRSWIARYAGVVGIALAYAFVRRIVLGPNAVEWAVFDDPLAPLAALGFGAQVVLAPFAALRYEPELAVWLSPARLVIASLLLATLVVAARRVDAPPVRVGVFWLGWFVVTQLPTANLLRQEARFDERYAFLASLAFPAVATATVAALATTPLRRRVAAAAVVALGLGLATLSVRRAESFRDDAAFAAQWLRTNPNAPEAHHLLAVRAAEAGRVAESLAHYRDAVAGAPSSPDLRVNFAVALATAGQSEAAHVEIERALALDPGHPEARTTLGTLLARAGRLEEAAAQHRAAIESAPRLAPAWANLGSVLARLGRWEEAEGALREALRLRPGDPDAKRNLDGVRRAIDRAGAAAPPTSPIRPDAER